MAYQALEARADQLESEKAAAAEAYAKALADAKADMEAAEKEVNLKYIFEISKFKAAPPQIFTV